jgi:hypothetical protein
MKKCQDCNNTAAHHLTRCGSCQDRENCRERIRELVNEVELVTDEAPMAIRNAIVFLLEQEIDRA